MTDENIVDLFYDIEAAQFHIDDSDDDEQFTLSETLAQLDKVESEFKIKNKSKPNVSIGRDDERMQRETPKTIETPRSKTPENRPAKTIQNFFVQNTNETQEKRSRPSLLDCLEEDYRKSPAKIKCNAKTPNQAKILTPVNLIEGIASPVLTTMTVQSPSSIENKTIEKDVKPDYGNATASSTAEYEDEEMCERTETPTMTEEHPLVDDKSGNVSVNTSNSDANKSKVIVSPKQQKVHNTTPKSMKKERNFMENYFKRSTPKSDQMAKTVPVENLLNDSPTNEMEVDISIGDEELDSEINNETNQLKALHVASDQVILNIEDSSVIT